MSKTKILIHSTKYVYIFFILESIFTQFITYIHMFFYYFVDLVKYNSWTTALFPTKGSFKLYSLGGGGWPHMKVLWINFIDL